MDPIRSILGGAPQPVALPRPAVAGATLSALPKPATDPIFSAPQSEANFDAEQKRFEAVQRAAQGIANLFVISDQRFTIFKDSAGQYITRFTNLRDGRVMYIPEPDLLNMARSAPAVTLDV